MRDFSFINKQTAFVSNKKIDLKEQKEELLELEYLTELKQQKKLGINEKKLLKTELKKIYRIK